MMIPGMVASSTCTSTLLLSVAAEPLLTEQPVPRKWIMLKRRWVMLKGRQGICLREQAADGGKH
eukprot:1159401-Pelagomonas_calceolata.AAC.1